MNVFPFSVEITSVLTPADTKNREDCYHGRFLNLALMKSTKDLSRPHCRIVHDVFSTALQALQLSVQVTFSGYALPPVVQP